MNPEYLEDLLNCALTAANAGAAELVKRFGGPLDIQSKTSAEDKVTDADLASEKVVRGVIAELRPNDTISGEELAEQVGDNAAVRWSIDPLDGTVNYTRGIPYFATSVGAQDLATGLWVAGAVVAPALNTTYFAKRGGGAWVIRNGQTTQIFGPPADRQTKILATGFSYSAVERAAQFAKLDQMMPEFVDIRRMGSAALDACMVADGTVDVYYEKHIKEHDWAAALLIAEEAGQTVKRPEFVGDFGSVNL
ncbi:inositol monophosphatase family protein [Rhodoluna limnophila]|uniref:inositol monophosphatase family protein n=1 Tax=Rhodoluna limnophila TaxID=232537 RepID=UPI001106CDDF|nr:inositol monophosphatase family protein [Rhodoluna limnophila]